MSELSTITTASFSARWNDRGSGASRDGAFWHPVPKGDMRPLGSVAVPHYNDINGINTARLFGPGPGAPGAAPMASPIGYNQIWKDEKSGADKDGSFWRPIPPNGYVALGDVARSGWSPAPSVSDIWCVRRDLVKQGSFGSHSVWDDKKSGARHDVSVWEIRPVARFAADGEAAASEEADGKEADGKEADKAATYLGPIRASQNYSPPDSSFAQVPRV
ncbi:vacuolar protein sorting-associated protein 62 [Trichoderma austrokoningii]